MERPQTLGELIDILGGKLTHGSSKIPILSVSSPDKADETDLVFAEDALSAAHALNSCAAAIVLKPGLIQTFAPWNKSLAVVEASSPRLWFANAANLLNRDQPATGVHPTAFVAPYAVLADDVSIGPGAVIDESACIGKGSRIEAGAIIGPYVKIGEYCHIYPRVTIYHGTSLGNHVVVHAGAVLGGDGFGYVRDNLTGAYTQFPQQGTLVIEDDVEIGANSTIDRGALKKTRIGRGTKIDNLVHIGHNCDIGEDVIIVALTGISGSCTVGNGAVIAGQVGIGDHAHVGPGVILGGQAGVLSGKTVTNEGLKPGTVLWGTPARPLMQVLRELAILGRLAKADRKRPDTEKQKQSTE
jgi:UDP-3-O-[3-hydroxymyristoyl] glucosamine N-acyltransferase